MIGGFTNSRLHHLQTHTKYQPVVGISCSSLSVWVFIVRQDAEELLESRCRGVKQVVRLPWQGSYIKWTPLLLVSSGLADEKWHTRVQVGSECQGKAKRVSVVCYKLSSALSQSVIMTNNVSFRHGEGDNQSCIQGLRSQEQISRIQTFFLTSDKRTGIGAIWLPNIPGTPGPVHSRTDTAPRNRTEV